MANPIQRFQEYQPSKTALFWSCVATAVVVLVLGFTWGGWVTAGTAKEMASNASEEATEKIAAAVCVEEFMGAPDARAQLASLKEIEYSWDQREFVEEGGWTKIAGEEYEDAAALCAERLAAKDLPPAQATDADMEAAVREEEATVN